MPRPKKSKKKRSGAPSAVELLEDVRDVMLLMLAQSCCLACSGTGKAHVDNSPEGKPVFGPCSCRRRSVEFLRQFDVDVEGFEEVEGPEESEGEEAEPEPESKPRAMDREDYGRFDP